MIPVFAFNFQLFVFVLTKEELQERALLVRIHEANCNIEHPTALELNFRVAIMKRLAGACDLRELRAATIEGPAPENAARLSKRNS